MTGKPDIETPAPIVHNVCGALDDLGCSVERLHALLDSNIADMHDYLVEATTLPPALKNRAYSIWMIFVVIREKHAEHERILVAINDAAHQARAARS